MSLSMHNQSPVLIWMCICSLDSLEKVDFQPIPPFVPRTKGVKVPISTLVLGTNGGMG